MAAGHPAPPQWTPTPGPKRRRPSAWWFALPFTLFVIAAAAGVFFFARTITPLLQLDGRVPVDGQEHLISLTDTGPRMLWVDPRAVQDCVVRDGASRAQLGLTTPGGSYTRADRSSTQVGASRFDPVSDSVLVTCTGDSGGFVAVGPFPEVTELVGGVLATVLVPLLFGGLGLVALVLIVVLYATGADRGMAPRYGPRA